MQRWIAAGLVIVLLGIGGGLFGYRYLKQNRPAPIWVPLQVRADLPFAEREKIVSKLKSGLANPENLAAVCKDLNLAKKWGMGSDEAASRELGERLFVKAGEMDSPMGKVPSINIGVTGVVKEREVLGEIAMRLMEDVWGILGIEPPGKE